MMPALEIRGYLKADPFRPFQIRTVSGRTYDIRHPEMLWVGGATIIVFTYVSDNPEFYDRWETVSLMMLESIAFLETVAA